MFTDDLHTQRHTLLYYALHFLSDIRHFMQCKRANLIFFINAPLTTTFHRGKNELAYFYQ